MSRRLDSVAIALGMPKPPQEKIHKLKGFLLSQIDKVDKNFGITLDDIDMPLDENNTGIGVAFIMCKDSQAAKNLATRCDYMQLDKKTKIRVFTRDQYEKYFTSGNEPKKPVKLEAPDEKEKLSLAWYYMNDQLLDQIVYTSNKLPHAVWFNNNSAELKAIELPNYLQSVDDINFTTDGSFFITRSGNRLNFYCTEKWIQFSTIEWPQLDQYVSSPCGRYILTKAKIPADIDNLSCPNGAAIWDILKGSMLARVPLNKADYNKIMFGAASSLFVLNGRRLTVYKAPEFAEAVEVCPDADMFSPSLVAPIVFTFREGNGGTPPRIMFTSTETMKRLHVTSAFNTTSCEIVWHPKLAMCAVIQQRTMKGRDSSALIVFDFTKDNIGTYPNENIRGVIHGCSWDPTGRTLAAIVASSSGRQLHVFEIGTNMNTLDVFPCAGVSGLQFSPSGRFLVADSIKESGAIVQFWDTQSGLIVSKDMDGVDGLQWDPSGAFIIASASKAANQSTWFSIILLDGNQVLKSKVTDLARVMWRPRTADSLPSAEDVAAVKPRAEEIIKKSGRFGAIDLKSRQEEQRQQKIEKLRHWNKSLGRSQTRRAEATEDLKFHVDPQDINDNN